MKSAWIRREGADELLLFFNGWGMDQRIAEHLLSDSLSVELSPDILACHDYRSLRPEPGFIEQVNHYSHITVVAWSFGVWVAQQIELPPIDRALAVNGTLCPIDKMEGIPPDVFDATLATYSEESRNRFNRRMCGGGEAHALFCSISPQRDVSGQHEELWQLKDHVSASRSKSTPAWNYNLAIIGGRDLVFPAQQQYHAWRGLPQTIIADMPHFPFFHFRSFQELLACLR